MAVTNGEKQASWRERNLKNETATNCALSSFSARVPWASFSSRWPPGRLSGPPPIARRIEACRVPCEHFPSVTKSSLIQ
jgi:hypothetical protein